MTVTAVGSQSNYLQGNFPSRTASVGCVYLPTKGHPMRPVFRTALLVIALVSLINAVWMLAHGWSWFAWIPGVHHTGPANLHLIRDVGLAYGVFGASLLWCLRAGARSYPLFLAAAAFYGGHALGHVVEILTGHLPHSHWWIDLPLVFLPGMLLLAACPPPIWKHLHHG